MALDNVVLDTVDDFDEIYNVIGMYISVSSLLYY